MSLFWIRNEPNGKLHNKLGLLSVGNKKGSYFVPRYKYIKTFCIDVFI